jgi:hypothetical protein
MKLWLISQNQTTGYDTYDSAVVVAESETEAKSIHPSGYADEWSDRHPLWATSPNNVTARYLGENSSTFKNGDVICASFNAG